MRPIDGDKIGLNDIEIVMCEGSHKKALEMLIDKINNAPAVDAVPVVRCKDCYWWEHKNDEIQGLCRLSRAHPTGKWYCADGTRKKKFEEYVDEGERKEETK